MALMQPEEMREFVTRQVFTKPAKYGVVFDKGRLGAMTRRLLKRYGRQADDIGPIRDFVSEEERDSYFDEFGPYATAFANDAERDYFRRRRDELMTHHEFDIDPILDMAVLSNCVMDEILLQRLYTEAAEKPNNASINKQIAQLHKEYRQNLDILAATRKQRKEGQESEAITSLAKAVSELNRTKEEKLKLQERYEREEQELLRRKKLRPSSDALDYETLLEGEVLDVDTETDESEV